jgi:hypothetical protein
MKDEKLINFTLLSRPHPSLQCNVQQQLLELNGDVLALLERRIYRTTGWQAGQRTDLASHLTSLEHRLELELASTIEREARWTERRLSALRTVQTSTQPEEVRQGQKVIKLVMLRGAVSSRVMILSGARRNFRE